MNKKRERDEHLEHLWYMKEEGRDLLGGLQEVMKEGYDFDIIEDLAAEGMVDLSKEKDKIRLTKRGEKYSRQLIRAHRLAERLLHDVLGGDFESGACEFEHTVTPELVDSICTLLGHPRTCPHGMEIPEGECCRKSSRTAQSSVIPLVELKVGQSSRIAYINCQSDQQLHRIDGLCLRPGAVVKLHQKYPSYVVECENSNIAMDEQIASNICVWREPKEFEGDGQEGSFERRGTDKRRGRFRHRKRRRL